MVTTYIPERGELVWLEFQPQVGHEQSSRRPALVLSPRSYNDKVGLMIACPITSKSKGYPFEVRLPIGLSISGVVLSDQIKSMDWKARQVSLIEVVPTSVVQEVIAKLNTLLT